MQYHRGAQELLRQAAQKARTLGHSYVGSVHLLMALTGLGIRETILFPMVKPLPRD